MSRTATFVVALLLALFQTLGVAGAAGAPCGPVVSSCAQHPCCRSTAAPPAEPQLRTAMACCRAGTTTHSSVPVATTQHDETCTVLAASAPATNVLAGTVEPYFEGRRVPRPAHVPIFLRNRSLLL